MPRPPHEAIPGAAVRPRRWLGWHGRQRAFFGAQLLIDVPGTNVDVAQVVVIVGGMEKAELFLNWLDAQSRQASLWLAGLTGAAIVAPANGSARAANPEPDRSHALTRLPPIEQPPLASHESGAAAYGKIATFPPHNLPKRTGQWRMLTPQLFHRDQHP